MDSEVLFFLFGGVGVGWESRVDYKRSCSHAQFLDATLTGPSLVLATRPKASLMVARIWNRLHMEENLKIKLRSH